MSLPHQLFAPAFRHQKLGWFLSVVVGVMVYVATFAMAAEVTLSALTFTWDQGIASHLTVEVPAIADESAIPQADRVKQIMSVLRVMPGVALAMPVPDDETMRLLKPWINQPEILKSLPLPTLIDIERAPGARLDAIDVQGSLKSIVRDVRVDDHAAWMADLEHLIDGLAVMAALTILVTGVTLVITVTLICRAVMATERETVSLLHVIGAEDKDIARHFQQQTRHLSWPPAMMGFGLAIISAGCLIFFLRNFVDPLSISPLHWAGLGAVTLLVPLIAVWVAARAARFSILQLLHEML